MSSPQARVAAVGLAFLLIFLSGIWLSRAGKPYNTLVFAIHKLIGLAVGAFLIVTVVRTHQLAPLASIEIIAVAVTALFFVGTVVAGGMLSIDKPTPPLVSRMHLVVPFLAVLSTGGTLYLLLGAA